MIYAQLKEGKILFDKINNLTEFQRAFQEPCMKTISAHSMNAEKPFHLNIESGSELYKIIDDYISKKLEELKKQFEEI